LKFTLKKRAKKTNKLNTIDQSLNDEGLSNETTVDSNLGGKFNIEDIEKLLYDEMQTKPEVFSSVPSQQVKKKIPKRTYDESLEYKRIRHLESTIEDIKTEFHTIRDDFKIFREFIENNLNKIMNVNQPNKSVYESKSNGNDNLKNQYYLKKMKNKIGYKDDQLNNKDTKTIKSKIITNKRSQINDELIIPVKNSNNSTKNSTSEYFPSKMDYDNVNFISDRDLFW